jgi:sugar phosphate isomerase/epimerase
VGRSARSSGKAAGRRVGVAISPRPVAFGPLLFAGDLNRGLRLAGELGFDVVELSLRAAADIDRSALKRLLNESGLSVSALATAQACLFDSLCLSSDQAPVREATVKHLQAEIELAAELGSAIIFGGIRGRLDGEAAGQAGQRAAALDAMARCAHHAAGMGVEILIEPINRYETNFINTTDEAIALLNELKLPGLRILLDTFHMNIEEVSITDAIRRAGSHLGYVHLVDSNRRAPGQGHLPFDSILGVLDEIGFAGPLVAEVMPLPDDETAARHTAEFWSAA